MRLPRASAALLCLSLLAAPARAEPSPWDAVDTAILEAIAQGRCPGAVLYVGQHDQPVHRKAYGHRSLVPEKTDMTVGTIFDLASLTKPVATSTAAMILADQGKLKVADPVAKYLPDFANHGKEPITLAQLLLHRGGLISDNPLSEFDGGKEAGLRAIFDSSPKWPPGSRFAYSDVGFIVLGRVVETVAAQTLDQFAAANIFKPLGMTDTTFNPPEFLRPRIAPTETRHGQPIVGQVHDPRAFAMDGVAGHAGLFSTADDLARFCRMILHRGQLDGHRILSAPVADEWTRPHPFPAANKTTESRTYGFDVDTPYSSPRGDRFPRGTSFGHTGFTGTSLWIDPTHDCFVILLTNSVHPDGKGNVIALRRKVATLVAEILLGPPAP